MLRAHLPSKHYVSISITKTHVKGFFTLKAAISLCLICTLIRVYHFKELHVVYTFFLCNYRLIHLFLYVLYISNSINAVLLCEIDIIEKEIFLDQIMT